ncbi:MAG TPA: hypothetical protein VFW07_02365 [Parafilimonas sp.]|nr:hypothetical protein [Parafilimonas sp.]
MKKVLVLILIASAFFTISATAQGGKKGMGLSKQTLMDSLKISSETADSVVAIRQASMSQMKIITSDQSLSKEDKKAKLKPLKQETQTRLKKFLSDDQIAKLREMEMTTHQGKKKAQPSN